MSIDTKVRKYVLIYLNTDHRGNLINQSQRTRCRTPRLLQWLLQIYLLLYASHNGPNTEEHKLRGSLKSLGGLLKSLNLREKSNWEEKAGTAAIMLEGGGGGGGGRGVMNVELLDARWVESEGPSNCMTRALLISLARKMGGLSPIEQVLCTLAPTVGRVSSLENEYSDTKEVGWWREGGTAAAL